MRLLILLLLVSCGSDKIVRETTYIELAKGSTEVIQVCEDEVSGEYQEVILKIDNVLVAFLKLSNSKEFLTTLRAGQCYTTTDGHYCNFCLDNDGNLE